MFGFRLLKSWRTPAALLGMGAVGLALGTWRGESQQAAAQQPVGPVIPASTLTPSDYSQRAVAQVYGNVMVSREELGEFLIARYGYANLELFVNRRIIEHACKLSGVVVSDAEVEAKLDEDLKPMNLDRVTFVKHYLKQNNKTLYEWKEDVLRPQLMLTKLCKAQIKVEEEDLRKAFESTFGEKVQCRIIIWKKEEERQALQMHAKIRESEAEFAGAAAQQYIPALAARGGMFDPLGKGMAEKSDIERIAFRLQPGQVSELFLIEGQGIAVLKCDGRIPPAKDVTFEKEREKLHKLVFDQKLAKAIPVMFAQMKKEADPKLYLPHGTSNRSVIRTKEEEERLMKQEPKTPQTPKPTVPLPMTPNK